MSGQVVPDNAGHVLPTAQDRQHTLRGVVLSGCPVGSEAYTETTGSADVTEERKTEGTTCSHLPDEANHPTPNSSELSQTETGANQFGGEARAPEASALTPKVIESIGDSPQVTEQVDTGLTPEVWPAAPFAELPPVGPELFEEAAANIKAGHPVHADRFADGTLRPGFVGPAFKHGARSLLLAAAGVASQVDAATALQERVRCIVDGKGGDDAVSDVMRGLIRRHAKLEAVEETAWRNIEEHGFETMKGRTRAAVTLWFSVVDRLHRSALTIGLERKARHVGNVAEQLAALHRAEGRP